MLLIAYRTTILYFIIMLSIRLMGKRQISQMDPADLVTTILISNIVTLPIEDAELPLVAGILPTMLLICYEVFTSFIILKIPSLRKKITGSPIVVIEKGCVVQNNLALLRMSSDDLMEQLRLKNVFDIKDVYTAIIETNGEISVQLNWEKSSPTMKDMRLKGSNTPPQYVVIADGAFQEDGLKAIHKSKKAIGNIVKSHGLEPKQIYNLTCNTDLEYRFSIKK